MLYVTQKFRTLKKTVIKTDNPKNGNKVIIFHVQIFTKYI